MSERLAGAPIERWQEEGAVEWTTERVATANGLEEIVAQAGRREDVVVLAGREIGRMRLGARVDAGGNVRVAIAGSLSSGDVSGVVGGETLLSCGSMVEGRKAAVSLIDGLLFATRMLLESAARRLDPELERLAALELNQELRTRGLLERNEWPSATETDAVRPTPTLRSRRSSS